MYTIAWHIINTAEHCKAQCGTARPSYNHPLTRRYMAQADKVAVNDLLGPAHDGNLDSDSEPLEEGSDDSKGEEGREGEDWEGLMGGSGSGGDEDMMGDSSGSEEDGG